MAGDPGWSTSGTPLSGPLISVGSPKKPSMRSSKTAVGTTVAIYILVFGALVGMIGSGIAASRFLDV